MGILRTEIFFTLFILATFIINNASANVYSCGGFVKSPVPIDFSKMTVKLLTKEGHLKHDEELNPQNGYFIIPVYSKGRYILKVSAPAGYHFDPDEYLFELDGVNDACTKGENIIFNVIGFSITGAVDGADSGMELFLLQSGKVITSTKTLEGGKYEMVAPSGKYEVSTAQGATQCISRGKTSIEVLNAPTEVVPNLKVSGYQCIISTLVEGRALPSVDLTLYTPSKPESLNCSKVIDPLLPSNPFYECPLGESDANGKVEIACLPIGRYTVLAKYVTDNAIIKFTPDQRKFEVKNSKVEANFSAISVSIRGRVVVGEKGLQNVIVSASGKSPVLTDENGYYLLANFSEGTTQVTAKDDNVEFSVANVVVDLPKIHVPDIVVEKLTVCGSIEADGEASKLTLKNEKGGEVISVRTSVDGSFCTAVPPGKYTISPHEPALTPRSLALDLLEKPVSGIRFTRFKTEIEVRLSCIGACPTAIVSLILNEKQVQSAQGTDVFKFSSVEPGSYTIRIDDNNRGCWENRQVKLNVERSKPAPVQLVQTGFATKVRISHAAKIHWSHVDKKQLRGSTETTGDEASFCVPVQGRYLVQLESCYTFQQPSFEINVPSETVHEEKAVSARISGRISNGEKAATTVRIRSSAGDRDVAVSADGVFTFDEPISSKSESLLLTPHSKTHLFEPTSTSVSFVGECLLSAAQFSAIRGIFIEGAVRPAVSDVNIEAVLRADQSVVLHATTDAQGNYKIGPVKKIEDYTLSAKLDGYKFTENKSKTGQFDSVRLSQLSITVLDEATSSPLDGVVLSLISDDYRSNTVLDSSAHAKFVALAPGEYYVRALLQEYKFVPSTTKIVVKEGEHDDIQLKGKRVSYSAYGRVREMSGVGVENVVVEALSTGCDKHQSEAVSASDGVFRVRGLLPSCKYRLYAKALVDGSSAPHSYPSQFNIYMTADDVKDLELVVRPVEQTTELAVEIDMAGLRDVQSVRVSISKGYDLVQSSVLQSPVNIFYLPNIARDGAEYSVRVEPDRPAQAFAAKTVFFTADVPVRVVRLPISSTRKAAEVEISVTSFLSLPFFVALALIFFNQNKAIELFKTLFNVSAVSNSQSTQRKRK